MLVKKVLISPIVLPEYRVVLYNKLNEDPNLDITIAHGTSQNPIFNGKITKIFKEVNLKNREFKLFGFIFIWQSGLIKEIIKNNYDVFVVQANFGNISTHVVLLYRYIFQKRNIAWVCAYERPEIRGIKRRIRNGVTRIMLKLCHSSIAYNSFAKRHMINRGVCPKKIRIIGNTTDTIKLNNNINKIDLKKCKQELKINKNGILFVGKFTESKKLDLLINAMAELITVRSRNDIQLILVGDGPVRQDLIKLSQVLGISGHVHFEGVVIEGKEKYFKAATIAVMPGSGGLFINDCMAAGLPMILSYSDGTHHDLIRDGETGILFRRDNKNDLSDKIEKLLDNASLQNKIKSNATKMILSRYKIDDMAANFIQALKNL